jgi:hypothetical protein
MNEADVLHYEQINEMLLTQGWKNVVEELQGLVTAIGGIDAVKNADELYYKKGQLNIANLILNLPHTVEQAIDVLSQESQDD